MENGRKGRGVETTVSASITYSIYTNKVGYTGNVDLRRRGGGPPLPTWLTPYPATSLQEVITYGGKNGRWSKSGLPAPPYDEDEEWNRVRRHWRRRGEMRQT